MVDPDEQQVLDHIAEYGCHVTHVLEEGDLPPFAYSVGITRSSGAPELIVIGLKQPMAHFVVNEYNTRVRAGERFEPGQRASGFLGGFDVEFRRVDRSHYREHLGWALWLHQGIDFETLQLVYPNTSGVWPWEAESDDWFRARQPLLDTPRTPGE
ncbi:MAG: DUF4262 domain-containing protein [Acidobacteriota bacterium]